MRRLGRRSASVAVVAVLITAAGARAATPAADQWSGRWEVTFTTSGNGSERKAGPLCCVEVQQVSTERGLALARGETGDVRNNPFTDVVCGQAAPGRLYYEGTSPFEFVSGVQGVIPVTGLATAGAHVAFCTDDSADAIRGHYSNDQGALDPLIQKPVTQGSLLARRGAGQQFEGSLTRLPGDFPGPTFLNLWEGECLSGPCRQVLARPRLTVRRLSAYNVLVGFLRGVRGTRLELTRSDGSARAVRLGESIDLQDGDVVTSHGTYADVDLTRADGTVVSLSIEPGGSIGSGPDPMVIRHRGGRVIAGSLAGFTTDSSVFDSGPNAMAAAPSGVVRTTVTKGRVALALDPSGRALTVRSLAGKAVVQAGSATLALPAGAEALATSTKVRRLPPAPDLSRVVPAPRVLAAGPVQLVVPRRISSRSLSDARCLAVGLRSTGSAQVLVTLLAGTATRGSVITRSRLGVRAGLERRLCLPLSPKARGIPVGTPLTVALGVRAGALRRLSTGRIQLALA